MSGVSGRPAAVFREGDRSTLAEDFYALDGVICGEVEDEAAAGVPVKVAVGIIPDEEVHVNAVAVRPARGQSGASAEADFLLAAESPTERLMDGVKEFARPAWKFELGHVRNGGRNEYGRAGCGDRPSGRKVRPDPGWREGRGR